jgi:tRNA threonylcarbamoyl adenosine modification protein (Sua5/YciO/YrdC/YwlC family)
VSNRSLLTGIPIQNSKFKILLVPLHPQNPNPRDLRKVIAMLEDDGVIIFPTDTIYAMGCKLGSKRGLERLCRIVGKKPEKVNFSLICSDLAHISEFTAPLDRPVFRLMKNNLPGAFTFILKAGHSINRYFPGNKKSIGIRVPANAIAQAIVAHLASPLVVTTIHSDDEITEFLTDPEEIHEKFENEVDCVVDGGAGGNIPSTIIDCSGEVPVVVREGKGLLVG